MRIIIIGAGRVGGNLARSLADEEHEVYLIENNEEIGRKVDEKLDVKVILGNAVDPDVLKKVAADQGDLVIAVTSSDETNLVVCSLASHLGAKRRIARVRNISLSETLHTMKDQQFNIDEIINPELVAAQAIVRIVQAPGSCEVADFVNGRILLRAFEITKDSPICGLKIGELREEDFPWPFLIVSIARDHSVLIPTGDTIIQEEDRIYVLLPAPSLSEFLTFVTPDIRKTNKVVIYGATITGEHVAMALSQQVRDVLLLEEDPEKAEKVAGRLQSTRIINGSASEKDILTESGVEAADFFIATSDNDHSNLVSSVLAKKMGAKTTIITTQQSDYASIADALDIDAIINPHTLAVEQILQLVRGKGISSVTKLLECNAETLELVPEEGSAVTKAPIKDIHFPKNVIVGAVYSDSQVVLAKGDTHLKAGERVIVFCQEGAVKKLQKLFTR